jgi:hypothetical protein
MTTAPEHEVEQLARALARLLAAWWQARMATSTRSRAPPDSPIARSKGAGHFAEVSAESSPVQRTIGDSHEPPLGDQAAIRTEYRLRNLRAGTDQCP